MAVWYMVKRLDTGEINGHNTWDYSPAPITTPIGKVETQCHQDGSPHHLIVYVDAKDESDARFMADTCFWLWTEAQP